MTSMPRHPALCCQCGNLHDVTPTVARGLEGHYPFEPSVAGDPRCVVRRTCPVCKTVTSHAFLRADPMCDVLERKHVGCCLPEVTDPDCLRCGERVV